MRNIKYALHSVAASIAVASLAAACSGDDGLEVKPSGIGETVTLMAWQPGNGEETRVGFDSKGKAYWQAGDAIGVWSVGEGKFNSFILSTGEGTAKATFTGTVTEGVGQYAVYPYNENHGLSGTDLTYSLPDSYTYEPVDQTFFPDGKDGKSFGMPMYGTVTDNVVKFRNLGGVVCLLVDKMPAESGTVKVTEASNKLCGTFSASLSDDTPEIKTAESDTDNAVTFSFSGATEGKPGVFYLPVATGSYNLSILVADGVKYSYTTGYSVTVARSGLQALKVVTEYADNVRTMGGHKFVDLCLPSKLLWAETNIGAETAADDGDYFAWGETETKKTYDWSTYSWGTSDNLTKYNSLDGKTTLDKEDDAAYVNWGRGCRMPTESEFVELNNTDNCTWTWVSCTNSAGETINCYKVVSVKNGNFIYLPASGHRAGRILGYRGSDGTYWSSTLNSDVLGAVLLCFSSSGHTANSYSNRFSGYPVRPVAVPLSIDDAAWSGLTLEKEGSASINDAVWNK